MAKYKVGDKVRVRSDLEIGRRYNMENSGERNIFVPRMSELKGKIVTISYVDSQYSIEEYGFRWTDEMFEGIVKEDFNVFDTVKNEKYGIGTVTVCGIYDPRSRERKLVEVDFDNWNEDFPLRSNKYIVRPEDLTLIKPYLSN